VPENFDSGSGAGAAGFSGSPAIAAEVPSKVASKALLRSEGVIGVFIMFRLLVARSEVRAPL
jgi:hypothetical protein